MDVEKRALDRYLAGLPTDQLADLLEQQLLYPDVAEGEVLRQDKNVARTFQAVEIVLRRTVRRRKASKRKRGMDARQVRHLQRLEQAAGSEKRTLMRRLTEIQSNPERAQPTARSRALKRLAGRHPREYVQLVREEQARLELERKSVRRTVKEEMRREL